MYRANCFLAATAILSLLAACGDNESPWTRLEAREALADAWCGAILCETPSGASHRAQCTAAVLAGECEGGRCEGDFPRHAVGQMESCLEELGILESACVFPYTPQACLGMFSWYGETP